MRAVLHTPGTLYSVSKIKIISSKIRLKPSRESCYRGVEPEIDARFLLSRYYCYLPKKNKLKIEIAQGITGGPRVRFINTLTENARSGGRTLLPRTRGCAIERFPPRCAKTADAINSAEPRNGAWISYSLLTHNKRVKTEMIQMH